MSVASFRRFRRLLRSLSARELATFVADIHSARGHATTVRDDQVSIARGAEDVLVLCEPASSCGRFEVIDDHGSPDVVAFASDPPRIHDADVRVIGPRDLYNELLYSIGRAQAERIFRRHFGRSLSTRETETGSRVSALPSATVTVLAAVVLLAGVGVGTGLLLPGGIVDGDGHSGSAGEPRDGSPHVDQPPSAQGYPPGVSERGVTDPGALASAHYAVVANRSYTLDVVSNGSAPDFGHEGDWVVSRQTVHHGNETYYLRRTTGLRTTTRGVTEASFVEFADGIDVYRQWSHRSGVDRAPIRTDSRDSFGTTSAAYVRRFLSTNETRVVVTPTASGPRFTVIASGTPAAIPWPVRRYRAVADVDRRGFVKRLSVDFTRLDRAGGLQAGIPATRWSKANGRVELRFEYRNVGNATVSPPRWYPANGTPSNTTAITRNQSTNTEP